MVLAELVKAIEAKKVIGPVDISVGKICYDSREVEPGSLFVAIPGFAQDGHSFIAEAAEKGASALVLKEGSEEKFLPLGRTLISVADARRSLALLACRFYGYPSEKVGLVGITGTNGKTTVAYLMESVLEAGGTSVGVLSTIDYRFGGRSFTPSCTTPESADLQRYLEKMRMAGVSWAVMEVSSHALELERVHGCHFDGAIFTNLTQDHLDFHRTMEKYFQAKLRLFTELLAKSQKRKKFAIINLDDAKGQEIVKQCATRILTYGMMTEADVTVGPVEEGDEGMKGELNTPAGPLAFETELCGHFNLYNIMAAAAAALALEVPLKVISQGIGALKRVPGRFERVEAGQDFTVLVDYAHTDDALKRALKAARKTCPGKLTVVFGCGGNRDRAKRPLMGRAAARLADITVVTSDNPRFEEPEAIIAGILPGLKGVPRLSENLSHEAARGYLVIPDRREAIRMAIALGGKGDTVLIAGKGHEDYQIIGDQRVHFDDREEAVLAVRDRLLSP